MMFLDLLAVHSLAIFADYQETRAFSEALQLVRIKGALLRKAGVDPIGDSEGVRKA